MLGTTLIQKWRAMESTSYSSRASFEAIARGLPFCFRFNEITIMRRYYGSENETMDSFGGYPGHPSRTVITRSDNNILVQFLDLDILRDNGYIDGDKLLTGILHYSKDGRFENLALNPSVKAGNVSLFSLTKNEEGTVSGSIIFNPDGLDGNYYYALIFTSPE